jgi:hypothetical protein
MDVSLPLVRPEQTVREGTRKMPVRAMKVDRPSVFHERNTRGKPKLHKTKFNRAENRRLFHRGDAPGSAMGLRKHGNYPTILKISSRRSGFCRMCPSAEARFGLKNAFSPGW